MLTPFGFYALLFSLLGGVFTENRREAGLVFISLVSFCVIELINLHNLGAWYYVVIAFIDYKFLRYSIKKDLSFTVSSIFLISIVYNGLSVLEYNSQYEFIYSIYASSNKVLIVGLILSIYLSGSGSNGKSRGDNWVQRGASDGGHGSFLPRAKI